MHLTDKLKKPAAAGPSFLSVTVQFVKRTSHFEERIDLYWPVVALQQEWLKEKMRKTTSTLQGVGVQVSSILIRLCLPTMPCNLFL